MQYTPFISDIELPFYTSLASLKINHDKLSVSARKVLGLYQIRPADSPEASCRMQIHGNALTRHDVPAGFYRAEGMLKNVNTIEEYRNEDKIALLQQAARTIWDAINDGTIYSCPSLLTSFVIISFADLKKYKYWYWFGYPAIHSSPNWTPVPWDGLGGPSPDADHKQRIMKHLTPEESSALVDAVSTWRYSVDTREHGFFLAKKCYKPNSNRSRSLSTLSRRTSESKSNEYEDEIYWTVGELAKCENYFFEGTDLEDRYVCFADPSNYDEVPGWMLRNLLVLIKQRWRWEEVQILRYRDVHADRDKARSIVMKLKTDPSPPAKEMPKVTGWERNAAGKLAGRAIDLKEYMDPVRLANQSVDLNLKLMKWRISPNLNLEKVKQTKCLLLGAGTLGSYVARNLMGWGVRHITFIDNATVSFSNPVRQPLYTFQDCLDGGAVKAERAAQALKDVYPGVTAAGHSISIPMLGHPVTDPEKTNQYFEKFKQLLDEHDALFILMDTRESRWLPTIMGKASGKIVMNAALGFDTFVVMRHGAEKKEDTSTELGCYFCNDVVAPGDSVKNQTLDQQCTVTRPGIAAIASALLVELFVSVIQHPQVQEAPASTTREAGEMNDGEDEHPLGLVPHQIRGFLANFSNLLVTGKAYNCCSACSDKVVRAYREDGWSFVEKALNERGYVEELSGLKEVQRQAEEAAAELDFEEEMEEEGDGELI
ncbi:Autophagy protein 7 [Ascosphaera pollenicola]|nr:Autophagy protein 7 [Ascosphaera pollenicola]